MAQADTEDRVVPHQRTNRFDRVRKPLRVARPIGEKYSIGIQLTHLLCGRISRHLVYLETHLVEDTQDVVFDSVIESYDFETFTETLITAVVLKAA